MKDRREELDRASEACAHAVRLIDFADPGQEEAQDLLIEAYRELWEAGRERGRRGDLQRAEMLETRKTLAAELESCKRETDDEAIDALRELLESCGEKRDWEAARVQTELGRLIRDRPGEPQDPGNEVVDCFEKALAWYEKNQPDSKWLAELHSDLAQALAPDLDNELAQAPTLGRPSTGKALEEAEKAARLDPFSTAHRDLLARIYRRGDDLSSACERAKEAVDLDPDEPELHHRLAMYKWDLAESLMDPVAHKAKRKEASSHFEDALTLYESEQQAARRTTSWWLAMSYFAMSSFAEVPAHLQFVLTASTDGDATEELGLQAAAELWLAKTYRKLGKYLQAEEHALRAIAAARELKDERRVPPTHSLAKPLEDSRWPLWVVLALAHMQVAGCHSDRDGNPGHAANSLKDAREVLEWVQADGEVKADPGSKIDRSDTQANYWAECGRLLLAADNTKDAIAALRLSADIDPDEADVYLLLARAHARAAEQEVEADWQAHIRHAQAACRRTQKIGGDEHPDTKEAAKIEERLKQISDERSTAADADGKPRGGTLTGTEISS